VQAFQAYFISKRENAPRKLPLSTRGAQEPYKAQARRGAYRMLRETMPALIGIKALV